MPDAQRDRMAVLDARAPQPLHDAVDAYARATGLSRSEALRQLLCRALEAVNLWPPCRGSQAVMT